jgi:replication factor A1
MDIGELRVGMKNINVQGKIVDKSDTSEVYSKYGYNVHRISYVTLSDETGSIKLILWNDQIDGLSVGNTVQIENGYVSQFRGIQQLNVGKRNGTISIVK